MRPRTPHYLSRNETTRVPKVVAALTTVPGTRTTPAGGEPPVFQWAVTVSDQRTPGGHYSVPRVLSGTSRHELAIVVDDECHAGITTWLYAHQLAVHLSSSGLLDRLSANGWTVIRNALDGPAPSVEFGHSPSSKPGHSHAKPAVEWHKQQGIPIRECHAHPELDCPYRTPVTRWERRLIIADAAAVWPRTTLADITADLGHLQPDTPAWFDVKGQADLVRHDALTLSRALTTVLHWWDTHDAGNWGKTGATTGWNAMRHRMSTEKISIDTAHPATSLERAACYGGRRGLFRFGAAPPGTYEELDFYRAYTVITRDLRLPIARRASFTSLPLDHITLTAETDVVGLIAEVTLTDAGGRYPVRHDGRVWYPSGRVTTVLAGPEIRESLTLGILESVGPGQWYALGRPMAPWARWCLEQQENPETPPVVVRMLKHHGRAVIGKTAGHAYAHQDIGPAQNHGFKAEQTMVGPDRVPGWVIDLGGRRTVSYPAGEAEDSFPAILAYVESHVRLRLSRIVAAIGEETAVQCDTDGLIVSVDILRGAQLPALPGIASPGMPFRPAQIIDALNDLVKPLRVREKAIAESFAGTGPQHYQLGRSRKRSGIPGNAKPDGHGNLVGITYPSLMAQASHGQPDSYTPQPWSGKDPVCTAGRWVLDNGRTVPPQARLNPDGTMRIMPWEHTTYYQGGLILGTVQDPILTSAARSIMVDETEKRH